MKMYIYCIDEDYGGGMKLSKIKFENSESWVLIGELDVDEKAWNKLIDDNKQNINVDIYDSYDSIEALHVE